MNLDDEESAAALCPRYDKAQETYGAAVRILQARWNVTVLNPHFGIGGAIVNKRMAQELQEIGGFTHVLCVAAEECEQDEKIVLGKTSMDLYCVYIDPLSEAPADPRDLAACFRYVQGEYKKVLTRDGLLPRVYVHCHEGKHRSVGISAMLMAALTNNGLGHFMHYVESRHPIADMWRYPEFKVALKAALCLVGNEPTLAEAAEAGGANSSAGVVPDPYDSDGQYEQVGQRYGDSPYDQQAQRYSQPQNPPMPKPQPMNPILGPA